MANNTLVKAAPAAKNELVYMVGATEIRLTPEVVRNYLVSGNKERVTTQELVMFMNLCKYSGLNPWAKEAYCIKYGDEPATMVIGQEAYQKRAEANVSYDGLDAGIVVLNKNGELTYRQGTLKLPDEEIVGGWAEVYRKDRSHSTRAEVSFDEYAGRKKDGSLNGQWSKKPATMIRKVAKVQALRETFPSAFGGFYAAEEVGMDQEPTVTFVANENESGPAIEQKPTQPIQKQEDFVKPSSNPADALFG